MRYIDGISPISPISRINCGNSDRSTSTQVSTAIRPADAAISALPCPACSRMAIVAAQRSTSM